MLTNITDTDGRNTVGRNTDIKVTDGITDITATGGIMDTTATDGTLPLLCTTVTDTGTGTVGIKDGGREKLLDI